MRTLLLLCFLVCVQGATVIVNYGQENGTCPGATCNLRSAINLAQPNQMLTIVLKVNSSLAGAVELPKNANIHILSIEGMMKIQLNSGAITVCCGTQLVLENVLLTSYSYEYQSADGGALNINKEGTAQIYNVMFLNNHISTFGEGAMTGEAFATGAALENSGTVFCSACVFRNNTANADAEVAAYATASAYGAAIYNSGDMFFGPGCVFDSNVASCSANPGMHPESGGGYGTGMGGAIYNALGGNMVFEKAVTFINNGLSVEASSFDHERYGGTTAGMSFGGAIANMGTMVFKGPVTVSGSFNALSATASQKSELTKKQYGSAIFNEGDLKFKNLTLQGANGVNGSEVFSNNPITMIDSILYNSIATLNSTTPSFVINVGTFNSTVTGASYTCPGPRPYECVNSKCVKASAGYKCVCNKSYPRQNATFCGY